MKKLASKWLKMVISRSYIWAEDVHSIEHHDYRFRTTADFYSEITDYLFCTLFPQYAKDMKKADFDIVGISEGVFILNVTHEIFTRHFKQFVDLVEKDLQLLYKCHQLKEATTTKRKRRHIKKSTNEKKIKKDNR